MTSRPNLRTEAMTIKTSQDILDWLKATSEALQISRNELVNGILRDCMTGMKERI